MQNLFLVLPGKFRGSNPALEAAPRFFFACFTLFGCFRGFGNPTRPRGRRSCHADNCIMLAKLDRTGVVHGVSRTHDNAADSHLWARLRFFFVSVCVFANLNV